MNKDRRRGSGCEERGACLCRSAPSQLRNPARTPKGTTAPSVSPRPRKTPHESEKPEAVDENAYTAHTASQQACLP